MYAEVAIVLGAIAIFHFVGFCLLYRVKFEPENQRLILLNLAAVEFVYCASLCICYSLLSSLPLGEDFYRLVPSLLWFDMSFNLLLKFVMIYVIIDRTLDIYLHLRYPVIFTRSRIVKILCALWVFAIFSATVILMLALLYIKDFRIIFRYVTLTYVVVDGILLAISALSFLYLFSKVRAILTEINHNSSRHSEGTPVRVTLLKKLKIPIVILTTYFVFNFTGDVLNYLDISKQTEQNFHEISILKILTHVLWCLGLMSDVVIYIYLQRNIRAYIKGLFSHCFQFSNHLSPTSNVIHSSDVHGKSSSRNEPPITDRI